MFTERNTFTLQPSLTTQSTLQFFYNAPRILRSRFLDHMSSFLDHNSIWPVANLGRPAKDDVPIEHPFSRVGVKEKWSWKRVG